MMALLILMLPDDAAAAELLKAVQDKVAAASTVRVVADTKAGKGESSSASMRFEVRVKGKDRWSMRTEYPAGMVAPQAALQHFICTGRRIVKVACALAVTSATLSPVESTAELRDQLVSGRFMRLLYLQAGEEEKSGERPSIEGIRDGGTAKVGEVEARVIEFEYEFGWGQFEGQPIRVRLFVDPKERKPLQRVMTYGGFDFTETYRTFELDGEIPDSEFSLRPKWQVARAQAAQVARWIELHSYYTGRYVRTAEELGRRPADLEAGLFWPEGGFLPGGRVPKDPWGRDYVLTLREGRMFVASLGADGKPGGQGDDADAEFYLWFESTRPVGAPTERLKKHYEARVRLHLLGAAIRGYRDAYAELPPDLAALRKKPEWAEAWPDGGWLPAEGLASDPWGEAFEYVCGASSARVGVRDARSRTVNSGLLTEEERKGLETSGRPRLREAERIALVGFVDRLLDDDLDLRREAEKEIERWGAVLGPELDERLAADQDEQTRLRLRAARAHRWVLEPVWKEELEPLRMSITGTSALEQGEMAGNHAAAWKALRALAKAAGEFASEDLDKNGVKDFWTADVAGLRGVPERLALADAQPLEEGLADAKYASVYWSPDRAPYYGYQFQAMKTNRAATPVEEYRQDTGGTPKMGKVHHASRWAFCAFPAEHSFSGVFTFIVNEEGKVYYGLTQGRPVLEWPAAEELRERWAELR